MCRLLHIRTAIPLRAVEHHHLKKTNRLRNTESRRVFLAAERAVSFIIVDFAFYRLPFIENDLLTLENHPATFP